MEPLVRRKGEEELLPYHPNGALEYLKVEWKADPSVFRPLLSKLTKSIQHISINLMQGQSRSH